MDQLQKVFKAYDIRGVYPNEVNEDLAWKVGFASGQFLRSLLSGYDRGQTASNRLVVGRDMRPHSPALAQNLMEGIVASGLSCVDVGMVDTPMVYFAINHLGACGGIQVTASHNPIEYNGFKISGLKARPVGENTGLKEIRHLVSALRRTPAADAAAGIQKMDLWPDYRRHVRQFLRLDRPLKVVADASNGMAGKMLPALFDGADVRFTPLNFEVGKRFTHAPNPLLKSALTQLRRAVRGTGHRKTGYRSGRHTVSRSHGLTASRSFDFGACFDADADRCVFVDERGEAIRSDLVTALLARHFLRLSPGSTIVYDLRSSRVVAEEIRAAAGVPRRERVGHAFMKKALADTQAVFGGELSGHYYFRDNYNADSGAIAFAVFASVVSAGNVPVSELIAPLKRYVQSGEINFQVKDKKAKMDHLATKFADGKIDHLDGVTIQYDDWWFNVRPSNTEPLLRLNLEAKDKHSLDRHFKQLTDMLGQPVKE